MPCHPGEQTSVDREHGRSRLLSWGVAMKLTRLTRLFVRALVTLALAMALAPLIVGCVAPPPGKLPCPVPSVDAIETPVGVYYLFDQENMDKLAARLEGLRDGTCLG